MNDVVIARIHDVATEASGDEVTVAGSLGAQFLLWEYATAVASRLIGINPFDQPDVESAKIAARAMLEQRDAEADPVFVDGSVEVRVSALELAGADTATAAIKALLSNLPANGYLSIQAYLDRITAAEAEELRELFAKVTNRPVTFGWGPRFLHSTGQFHKGGARIGVYLQLVARSENDLAVPGRNFTFGELIASQAAGDANVLAGLGRPVLTLTLRDVAAGLKVIAGSAR
jgi:glucose-6-phosphate isomerase